VKVDAGTREVVVVGSYTAPADSIFNDADDGRQLQSVLTEIRLDTRTGVSTRRAVLSVSAQVKLEVGMVNRNMLGRWTWYTYLAMAEPWPKVFGFAEVDLGATTLARQSGHVAWSRSHAPTQSAWNRCPQRGRRRAESPSRSSRMHTAHFGAFAVGATGVHVHGQRRRHVAVHQLWAVILAAPPKNKARN
jgi:hypothetical protein